MRILVVHNYYQDLGGEDIVFHQEVEALKKKHSVETLTFKNRKGIIGLLQYLFYPYNIWAAFCLRKKVRQFHPEIIHVHNTHYASGPIIFRTAQRLRIPVVFTLHNYRLICPSALLFFEGKIYMESIGKSFPWDAVRKGVLEHSKIKTFLTAFTYKLHTILGTWKKIDAYLPLTEYAKSLILKTKLGITPERIIVKPNFISPIETISDAATEEKPYFLYVGRLSEEKGFGQLLQAFDYAESPPLKIIGEGPQKSLLEGLNTKQIEYLGYQEKQTVLSLIKNAKAIIVPSVCLEGFPMALLDAFASRTPVMISKIIAASEIIKDSENGYLINPFDFREDLTRMIKKEAGEKGYQLFMENYTKEKVMSQLEKIYADLIK